MILRTTAVNKVTDLQQATSVQTFKALPRFGGAPTYASRPSDRNSKGLLKNSRGAPPSSTLSEMDSSGPGARATLRDGKGSCTPQQERPIPTMTASRARRCEAPVLLSCSTLARLSAHGNTESPVHSRPRCCSTRREVNGQVNMLSVETARCSYHLHIPISAKFSLPWQKLHVWEWVGARREAAAPHLVPAIDHARRVGALLACNLPRQPQTCTL